MRQRFLPGIEPLSPRITPVVAPATTDVIPSAVLEADLTDAILNSGADPNTVGDLMDGLANPPEAPVSLDPIPVVDPYDPDGPLPVPPVAPY